MAPARLRDRAFTLVELLLTLTLIFLLMGLLLGGIRHVMSRAKATGDLNTASALKQGVEQFRGAVSFAPPLVMDMGPPITFASGPLFKPAGSNEMRVRVYQVPPDARFLRLADPNGTVPPVVAQQDMRFSLCSLPYYLLGVMDQARSPGGPNPTPIDGLAGPGFRTPHPDGTFDSAGRSYGPYFDVSRNAKAVFETQPGTGRFALQDSRGVAVRYYRWKANDPITKLSDLNIPWILGDPAAKPELKSADFAIVLAGPDGLFGDEWLLPPGHPQYLRPQDFDAKLSGKAPQSDTERATRAMADNIVVVGGGSQ